MPRRCVLGCPPPSDGVFHRFPNPYKKPDTFKAWAEVVGAKLESPEDYEFYWKKKIICDIHFKDEDKNRCKRLNALAVPSLFLAGADDITMHIFPNPEKETERFLMWTRAIGDTVSLLDPQFVFKNRRVCHDHFEMKHLTWTKKLSPAAVPTLKMPGAKEKEQPSQPIVQKQNAQDQQPPDVPQTPPDVGHESPDMDQDAPDVDQGAPDVDQGASDMDQDAVLESPCPSPEVVEESKPLPVPCKKCGQHIEGYRFACVSCVGCALCAACIVDGAHAACYVLRVPSRRPLSEVRAVLRACRDALAMERFADDLGGPLADQGPIEVKSESEHSDEEYDDVDKESLCEVMVRGDMDDNMDPLTSPTPAPSVGMPMVLSIEPNAAGGFILNTNTETVEPEKDATEYQVEALDSDFEEDTQSVSDDVYVPEESDEILESQTTLRLHSTQKESNHPAMRSKTYEKRPRALNQPDVEDSVHRSSQKTAPKVSREKRITTLAGSSLPLGPRGERTMVPVLTRLPIGIWPSLPRGEGNPIYSGAMEYKDDAVNSDVESQTQHAQSDSDCAPEKSDDPKDFSESQKTLLLQSTPNVRKRPKILRRVSMVPGSVSKQSTIGISTTKTTREVPKTGEPSTSNNQQVALESGRDSTQKPPDKNPRKVVLLKRMKPETYLLLGQSEPKSGSLVLGATQVPSGAQPSLKPIVINTENTKIFTRKRALERNDPSAPSAATTGSRSSAESAQAKRAISKKSTTGLP